MIILFAIFLFTSIWPPGTWAAAAPAPAPLVLPHDVKVVPASDHTLMLRDPAGGLSPDAALAAPGWRALPGAVSAGYTDHAIWLRLDVTRTAQAPAEWMVRFSNAGLDDVRLYRQDFAGKWTRQAAGADMARAAWPVDAREVVFPVTVQDGVTERWLIRLHSKKAMASELTLWPRAEYDASSRREYLYYGLQYGSYLLLILFHVFFWRMTRESHSGWYLLYVLTNVAAEALTIGIPQQIFNIPNAISDPMLGVSMALSLAVGARFSILQLELPGLLPRTSHGIVGVAAAAALAGAVLVLCGRYGAGVLVVQGAALPLIVLLVTLAGSLALRGHRPARAFLLIFGIFYVGLIVGFLRNMGVLPPNFWTSNAAPIGAFVHMMLMSLRLNRRYSELRRAKDMAQAESVQAAHLLNGRLEGLVTLRTDALQQEIGRRAALEADLRAALAMEQRAREEQQDFAAMVSHEFHTPLAIINTTAQQIARNPGAAWDKTLQRCQNLRDASARMTALVDDYLSADRLEMGAAPFRPQSCDPRLLLDAVLAEWPAGRVEASLSALPAHLQCDPGLLRVALRNLLSNADRYAPQVTPILLHANGDSDGGVQITVSNVGDPLPADEIPRLFQKYFRGRIAKHRPGAGLGLYLVQRIAALHGGKVTLDSAGANGVITFCLHIPPMTNDIPD